MRFLVDAQLPPSLAVLLESNGHEARAVRDVGLRDANDRDIWEFAEKGDWIVVTKDEDFMNRTMARVVKIQIVWLRIGNSSKKSLHAWFEPQLKDIIRELKNGHRLVELRR